MACLTAARMTAVNTASKTADQRKTAALAWSNVNMAHLRMTTAEEHTMFESMVYYTAALALSTVRPQTSPAEEHTTSEEYTTAEEHTTFESMW
jgi:hypothetical protein